MTERERIDSRLRDIVINILLEENGEAAIVHRTFDGKIADPNDWGVVSWPVPSEPLNAIRIAKTIEAHARWLWSRYVEEARGAGRTWLELADVLGVDENEQERDHEAFMIASGEPSSPFRDRYVSWKCAACGQRVKDLGPYGGHPTDCETGHHETCIRMNAEIDAYTAAWGDD